MASKWYLKTNDGEIGPKEFAELVELVRSQTVTEADFVRAESKMEWQRADKVIGLFYMARRSTAEPEPVDLSAAKRGGPVSSEAIEQPLDDVLVQSPSWMQRLLHILRSPKLSSTTKNSVVGTVESLVANIGNDPGIEMASDESVRDLATEPVFSDSPLEESGVEFVHTSTADLGLSSAIDSAMESVTRRVSNPSTSVWNSLCRRGFRVAEKLPLRMGYRLTVAILCIFFAVQGINRFSASQVQLIKRQAFVIGRQAAIGIRNGRELKIEQATAMANHVPQNYFPLIGECNDWDYIALMELLTVLIGFIAYRAAMLIDQYVSRELDSRGRRSVRSTNTLAYR